MCTFPNCVGPRNCLLKDNSACPDATSSLMTKKRLADRLEGIGRTRSRGFVNWSEIDSMPSSRPLARRTMTA